MPDPLVGAAALRAEVPWEPGAWMPVFLRRSPTRRRTGCDLLITLERAWFAARSGGAGQRSTSRAAAAIDRPGGRAAGVGDFARRALGMAVKNAAQLLDRFCADGIAVEVTHRSKRRLFGLAALAPLRDGVAHPDRPEPGRGRGRPPLAAEEEIKGPRRRPCRRSIASRSITAILPTGSPRWTRRSAKRGAPSIVSGRTAYRPAHRHRPAAETTR